MEAESQDSDLEVTEELEPLGQEKDEAQGTEEEGKFSFSFWRFLFCIILQVFSLFKSLPFISRLWNPTNHQDREAKDVDQGTKAKPCSLWQEKEERQGRGYVYCLQSCNHKDNRAYNRADARLNLYLFHSRHEKKDSAAQEDGHNHSLPGGPWQNVWFRGTRRRVSISCFCSLLFPLKFSFPFDWFLVLFGAGWFLLPPRKMLRWDQWARKREKR